MITDIHTTDRQPYNDIKINGWNDYVGRFISIAVDLAINLNTFLKTFLEKDCKKVT